MLTRNRLHGIGCAVDCREGRWPGRWMTEHSRVDGLAVEVHADREALGRAAAAAIAGEMRSRLERQARLRMIVASAPSQDETLAALVRQPDIDWRRVTLFHMDEFIGLPEGAPERFAIWLDAHLFGRVPAEAHRIEPGQDPEAEAARYARLLDEAPVDVVCLGIGVNGHIAFNDPPGADFDDPLDVKVVEMDGPCRQQQVDDGGFPSLDAVPRRAVTLTIPRLLRAERMFCMVPGAAKAEAVRACLTGAVTTEWPASVLRRHPACTLYLDRESGRDV